MRFVRLLAGTAVVGGVLAVSLISSNPALAAGDYYVSPSGKDSASGTSRSKPFRTIQKALSAAPSGATVHLAAGSYRQHVETVRRGVTIVGPPDAVVRGVSSQGRVFEIHHDDTTLRGFTIDGLQGSASSRSGYAGKLIYVMSRTRGDGVDRVRIHDMTLRNAGGECVRLRYLVTRADVGNNRIGPCGVYDFRFKAGGKNGEGIYLGTAPEQEGDNDAPDGRADVSRDNRIHGNTINTQGNECVDIKENSTRNIVENNRCTGQKDPKSAGFDARGSGNTFRFNRSYGNVGAGIRFGGDRASDGRNNSAYGNTITGNRAGGIKFQAAPQATICGNTMSGNRDGNSVGEYRSRFRPTRDCPGSVPDAPRTTTLAAGDDPSPEPGPRSGVCAVTASGDDGNVPANTIDGDPGTRWSADGSGAWIRWDLCAATSLSGVKLSWYKGDQRTARYRVDTSTDGTTWTTVVATRSTSGTTAGAQNNPFTARQVRYIRVVGFGNTQNEWTSITEFQRG